MLKVKKNCRFAKKKKFSFLYSYIRGRIVVVKVEEGSVAGEDVS